MNEKERKELYQSTFDKIHAPKELLRKVEGMSKESRRIKKKVILRRSAWAAAAVVILFVLSNAVVLAATGEPWVGIVFDWNKNPGQPLENVNDFFWENGKLFDADGASVQRQYYGGTYLDGNVQVILLTDMSRSDEFTKLGENVRYEKCEYSYDELSRAIQSINSRLAELRSKGEAFADDVVGMALDERNNRVDVDIYNMTDEKTEWFKKNISDAGYLVFVNADALPGED